MRCTAACRIRARRSPVFILVGSLVAMVSSGCDSTEPLRAVALAVVAEPPSVAQSGVELTQAPVLEIRDRNGAAFTQGNVSVTVSIATGGGTLGGTTTHATDANGRVTFPGLVIAGAVGPRTLRFSAQGLTAATSSPIAVGPGLAATMQAVSPLGVQATVATGVASLPSVVVKDASDNPVPDVVVTFTFASSSVTRTTNASGVATLAEWTVPTTVGQYTVVATAAGVAGSGITFTATATPGAPSQMEPTGSGQSVLYGSRLPTPLQVRVTDEYGNATPDVVVTWGSVSGLGTPEPINVATDADGIVRANYRLGTLPGENVIRASITSRNLSTDFTATALGFTNEIDISGLHSCALDESGVAYCWGQNDHGQLGDGTTERRSVPTRVAGTLRFRRITTDFGVTCALTVDNAAYCWGFGEYGTLGNGAKGHRNVPTPVGGGYLFTEIATGGVTTCGLTATGAAYCWGSNQVEQLGVGTGVQMETCTDPLNPQISFACTLAPMAVVGGLSFKSITAGFGHICALTSVASELYCWGLAWPYGHQGTTNGGLDPTPVRVAPTYTFTKVVATVSITCGIVAPSSAYCWGSGSDGEFGDGSDEDRYRATPGIVPGIDAVDIHAGGMTCAIVTDGRSFCWGFNVYGSVGDGTTSPSRPSPTPVSTSHTFTTIRASIYHSCGRATNGQVHCWGLNQYGELGVGDFFSRLTPALARP